MKEFIPIIFFVAMGFVLGFLVFSQPHLEHQDFLKWQRPYFFNATNFASNLHMTTLATVPSTGSMFSTIIGGEQAVILDKQFFGQSDIHVGDIIMFCRADNFCATHRVVELGVDASGWFAITQGDNNNIADGKVRYDEIGAKVVGVLY